MKLYRELATLVQARINCIKSNNDVWIGKHEDKIEHLVKQHMPSGSGFDNGTTIELDVCTGEKLVFRTSFHHMDDGMYDGWTEHKVTVTPSLVSGFDVVVSGRNRNDVKDYIGEQFQYALDREEKVIQTEETANV